MGELHRAKIVASCFTNGPVPVSDGHANSNGVGRKGYMHKQLILLTSVLVSLSACSGGNGNQTSTTSGTTSSSGAAGAGGESASGGSGGAGGSGTAGGGGSGTAGAGGGSAGESVVLRAQPCEKQPASATKCESFEVTCGGADPAIVDLVYFEPSGVPSKGAIIFGSGGDGTGFYNFTQRKALTDAGFTVLDRRWPAGWFTGAQVARNKLHVDTRRWHGTSRPTL